MSDVDIHLAAQGALAPYTFVFFIFDDGNLRYRVVTIVSLQFYSKN